MRRFLALVLALCCLSLSFAAEAEKRVYLCREGNAAPFPEGSETFDLYVCPLMGADCMALRCGGKTMLVDMGKANDYDTIKGVLDGLEIKRIDIAFNTHPHTDHLGSMIRILADYPVDCFMTAFDDDYTAEEVVQKATMKAVREAGVPVRRVEDGDVFYLGDAKLTVIRQTRYLRADILKWPHHGLNKVYRELWENADPEYVFFTHGYMNTKEAQEQAEKYGVPYDFATWGVIHLSSDGNCWLVDQTLNEMGERCVKMYR